MKYDLKKYKGFVLLDSLYALSIIAGSIVIGTMVFNNLYKKESLVSGYKSLQEMKVAFFEDNNKSENILFYTEEFEENNSLTKEVITLIVNEKNKKLEQLVINEER